MTITTRVRGTIHIGMTITESGKKGEKMRTSLILVAVILAISVFPVQGQEMSVDFKAAKPFALQSLETFKKLVTQENYAQMGFRSIEELLAAELGDPMQEYMVRLDHLQKYEPGEKPSSLLSNTNMVYYPVEVNRRSRSMILIAKTREKWQPVSYGSSRLIGVLSATRSRVRERSALDSSSFFVVRIPALNLYFLGHMIDSRLYLTLAHENPNYKLTSGKTYTGEEVFRILAPFAKAHDGLPR